MHKKEEGRGPESGLAAHFSHLRLIALLNVLAVLFTDLLVLLPHFVEDLGEVSAGSSVHFHMNIPSALARQLAHLLPEKKKPRGQEAETVCTLSGLPIAYNKGTG